MKTIQIKSVIFFLIIAFSANMNLFAQEKKDSTSHHHMMGKNHKMMEMKDSTSMNKMMEMKDSTSGHKMMKGMKHKMHDMKKDEMKMHSIIHKGEIDLKEIDMNKDGKVFQDMMDWNVISDSAGRCPLCNMKLKEVKLDEAKNNLKKHNFKVK